MKINNTFRAFMLLALMTIATNTVAQEYVVVHFKDANKNSMILQRDKVKSLEFNFKNKIEVNIGSDSLFYPASVIANYYIGYITSYAPTEATTDCDWAEVTLVPDTTAIQPGEYYSDNCYLSLKHNTTGKDRTATITFKSEGADDKTIKIFQCKYESTFNSEEPVKEASINYNWNDSILTFAVYPNFGIKLESYPEWVDSTSLICYNENDTVQYNAIYPYAVLRLFFKPNNTLNKREGTVVLSDLYGEELKINITQEEFSYKNILEEMNTMTFGSNYHFDFGYPSLLHIRDVMTGDLTVPSTGYDWFSSWACNRYMGEGYVYPQYIWTTYRNLIRNINLVIANVNTENIKDERTKGIVAVAHTYRALMYLEAAQMYEFLPNEVTSNINEAGNDVLNLTIPIVKDPIIPRNPVINIPRATKEEMVAFIARELEVAEKYIEYVQEDSCGKEVPHLDVVYGLRARLSMWTGDYENAKKYARMAIDNNTGHIMTREECLSTTNGFNTPTPWMLATTLSEDDAPAKSGIVNWTSWMSPEARYGYSAAAAASMIDARMYSNISDSDFRKLMFKAPEGGSLAGQEAFKDAEWAKNFPEYTAFKFRPNNSEAANIASATSCPIMRIEEMYFIEAEAAERLNEGDGKVLLENFMREHRDANYTFPEYINAVYEILFQKRVEFWGEGISFYDIKRANLSVTRGYEGTNVASDRQFNTSGRPAWMNICISSSAKSENTAFEGYENPDPTDCYESQNY